MQLSSLTRNLRDPSLDFCFTEHWGLLHGNAIRELGEIDLSFSTEAMEAITYTVSQVLGVDKRSAHTRQLLIARNLVFAAANAGNLKRMRCGIQISLAFAARALLPYWVGIEVWHLYDRGVWENAAMSLRPLLANASLWLQTTSTACPRSSPVKKSRSCRCSTRMKSPRSISPAPSTFFKTQSFATCLGLAEDEALAQRVADAWNRLVEDREADIVKCQCEKCKEAREGGL